MQTPQFLLLLSGLQQTPPSHFKATQQLLCRFYDELTDANTLSQVMYNLVERITSLGAIADPTLSFLQECIKEVIQRIVKHNFQFGASALCLLFDTTRPLYRDNRLDAKAVFPLGLHRPLLWYEPEVGEEIDYVHPYISANTFCGWNRAIVQSKAEDGKYTLKEINASSTYITREMPFCSKKGTRTLDYDWRMALNCGDILDAFLKVWYPSTIVQRSETNGHVRVRVSFRRFNEAGLKEDSYGLKYDGLGPNEDQWFDVMSSRLQRPNKMSRSLCYYSQTADQAVLDDTYDLIFEKEYEEKPFTCIMRTQFTRSLTYLTFVEQFSRSGGYDNFLVGLPLLSIDSAFSMMFMLAQLSPFIPRMRLHVHAEMIVFRCCQYVKEQSKTSNGIRLDILAFLIESYGKRILSLSEKHQLMNKIRQYIAVEFLKHNLQKQLIALKLLSELTRPQRPYPPQEEAAFIAYLIENNIFYKLMQSNVHEQILSRCVELLAFMLTKEVVGTREIQHIWYLIPQSDARGRTIIQKLLGQIKGKLKITQVQMIIGKILQTKQTELSIEKLILLRQLKDRELQPKCQTAILTYLWDCITIKSSNIKPLIQQQIELVFVSFISTLRDPQIRFTLLNVMLTRISQVCTLRNQIDLFKNYILSYPQKSVIQCDTPSTCFQAVQYLRSSNIYNILLAKMTKLKPQQCKDLLLFLQFLFQKDQSELSDIVREVYKQLGPNEQFLEWSNKILSRCLPFLENLCCEENAPRFNALSSRGLDALKEIIYEMNARLGTIKVVKKEGKANIGPANADGTKKGVPDKGEKETIVYVLRSPFQIVGIKFLFELIHHVTGAYVQEQLIKLVVDLMVSLDQKLFLQTQKYREEFLSLIFLDIQKILNQEKPTEVQINRLKRHYYTIIALFEATETQGLKGLTVHEDRIEGQKITLQIQPSLGKKKQAPFNLQVSDHISLWKLKEIIAEKTQINAKEIDIISLIQPISDKNNSKTLNELNFFKEQKIKAVLKPSKQVPRHDLLHNKTLVPAFQRIVQYWFNSYCNSQGVIGLTQLQKLSKELWKGSSWHKQMKQWLNAERLCFTLLTFKEYFVEMAQTKSLGVWHLINLSGYKNNLQHMSVEMPTLPMEALPRKILSIRHIYDLLFKLLERQQFAQCHQSYGRLLRMLQSDPQMAGVPVAVIDEEKCIYRLQYALEQITCRVKRSKEQYVQFYVEKGPERALNKVYALVNGVKSIFKLSSIIKQAVLPSLINIVNLYAYPLLDHKPIVRFLRTTSLNLCEMNDLSNNYKAYAASILSQPPNEIPQTDNPKENLSQMTVRCGGPFDPLLYLEMAKTLLNNLLEHFQQEYPMRLCTELFKLYACLTMYTEQIDLQKMLIGLSSTSNNFRRFSQSLLYIFIQEHSEQSGVLLLEIVKSLPKDSTTSCQLYFSLLVKLLDERLSTSRPPEEIVFFENMAQQIISSLLQEKGQNRLQLFGTKMKVGQLDCLRVILSKLPQIVQRVAGREDELITKCLFFYKIEEQLMRLEVTQAMLEEKLQTEVFQNYVRCKTDDTRKILYDVIQLIEPENSKKRDFFSSYITPILVDFPQGCKRTSSKVHEVGLNNLGSTCYLNSMLQVLNSVKPFRNAIMMLQPTTNLLKQLQRLFSYLFFSERVDYVPRGLLQSFTPPINPSLQQDTTEFLNYLFDQLQLSLKDTPFSSLLQSLFQGSQMAQMICHACGAKRQRSEQFFTYALDIEHKLTLTSALESMYGGQLIGDCLCQSCGQRANTTKRTVLHEVPNVFFIHLKRIVFNYDLFINTKIHTQLAFPSELNIEPYTKEGVELREGLGVEYLKQLSENKEEEEKFKMLTKHGKPAQYYQLVLKGIIIHSGTPDAGHYYAFLKKNHKWSKYDDSKVSIPWMGYEQESYGGKCTVDEWSGIGSSTNAYVLVYEKVLKNPLKFKEKLPPFYHSFFTKTKNMLEKQKIKKIQKKKEEQEKKKKEQKEQSKKQNSKQVMQNQITPPVATQQKKEQKIVQIQQYKGKWQQDTSQPQVPYNLFGKYNTPQLYKQIWLDNHMLMLETHLLSELHRKDFLKFILQILQNAPGQNPIQSISKILFNVCLHSGEVGNLQQIFLSYTNRITAQLTFTYVLKDPKRTFCVLFHHSQSIRIFATNYIFQMLIAPANELGGAVLEYVESLWKMLYQDAAKNWLRIDGYFNLLSKLFVFSAPNSPLWHYFRNQNCISTLIDFILQKNSPIKLVPKKYSLGTKTNPMNFEGGITLIYHVLAQSKQFNNKDIQLNKNDLLCLSSMAFFQKMIKQNQQIQYLAKVITLLATDNLQFSRAIARTVLKCLNDSVDSSDQYYSPLSCAMVLLSICDRYFLHRFEMIVGFTTPFINGKNILLFLQEQKFIYSSTLPDLFPVQCLLTYAYNNRTRNPQGVLNILMVLLIHSIIDSCPLKRQLSPTYINSSYLDWILPFIQTVPHLIKLSAEKESEVIKVVESAKELMKKIEKVERKNYIMGEVVKEVIVDRYTDQQLDAIVHAVHVYVVDSEPTSQGNATLDAHLKGGRLQGKVREDSNVLHIIKLQGKLLAIKEEHQEKELTDLFDQGYTKLEKIEEEPIAENQQAEAHKPIQEVKEEIKTINIESCRVEEDYLKKLELINLSGSTKIVTVTINKEADANTTLPSTIQIQVSAKFPQVLYYCKEDCRRDWGHFTFSFESSPVSDLNKCNFFSMHQKAQMEVEKVIQKEQNNFVGALPNEQSKDDESAAVQMTDQLQMKVCPDCTFLNLASASSCEICESSLRA